MAPLSSVGFEPPPDFPGTVHDRIHRRLAPLANTEKHGRTWRQFGLAWAAVAYRFQACADYDAAFRKLFDQLGSNTTGFDRYRQQRDLYGCVVSACSAIESFYYATYAVGALADSVAFPISTPHAQRDITPVATVRRFRQRYPDDVVVSVLGAVVGDPQWAGLCDLRNVLVHRAAPAKTVGVHLAPGMGAVTSPARLALSDFHLPDRGFDPQLTKACRNWVAGALDALCDGLDGFTKRHQIELAANR